MTDNHAAHPKSADGGTIGGKMAHGGIKYGGEVIEQVDAEVLRRHRSDQTYRETPAFESKWSNL